jgi:spermidine/putrescine ABC transporter ATP-binding subunit
VDTEALRERKRPQAAPRSKWSIGRGGNVAWATPWKDVPRTGAQIMTGPLLNPAEASAEARTRLEVRDLVRRYSSEVSVGPLSFSVHDGEFFSLLGPSGCGKTTTLRCIAGFESVDSGVIVLGGRNIERVAAHKRGVGLVFQSHALFPHLSVAGNVAFGLKLQKIPKPRISERVTAALALVEMSKLAHRMPSELSGGQQQRVALARSLVMEPPLLLLDEPLSSLDLKLRIQMREELRELQRRLRMTTIFVTHDQTEALALSDRIAVLSQGSIEQVGTPQEIYARPASRFVAEFIGSSNLLDAKTSSAAGSGTLLTTASGLRLVTAATTRPAASVTALVRPERVRILQTGGSSANLFPAEVRSRTYLGDEAQFQVLVDGKETMLAACKLSGDDIPDVGHKLFVRIEPIDVFLLPS